MTRWLSENRSLLIRLIGTFLAIGLIALLIHNEGLDEIKRVFSEISLWDFLLAVAILLVSRIFVTLRWYVLLRSGKVDITLNQATQLTFMGLFANNFLPTTIGGDVVRLAGVIQLGYDRAVCLASIAADRVVGILSMVLVLPLGLIPLWNTHISPLSTSAIVLPSFIKKLWDFGMRTLQSFSTWLQQPKALFMSFVYNWGNLLFIFGSFYVLIRSIGFDISFWLAAGIWGLAYFVTLVPISINGYGVQELSLTFLLSSLAGLDTASSITVAVLIRLVFVFASLPGAIFLPAILDAMAQDKNKQE